MRGRQPQERRHDAPYGAEQTHEWAGGTGSREERQPILELGHLDVLLTLHRTRHVLDTAKVRTHAILTADHLALGAGELEQLLVSGAENLRHRRMHQPDACGIYRGEIFRFPENRGETIGLAARARGLQKLVDDNPPASD